jgi:acetamidase/formamidase
MACRGSAEPGDAISVRGSYAAPPDPDWGWRTAITPGMQVLRIVMRDLDPGR